MGGLLAAALGLGLAGLDPAGALIVAAALTAGGRERVAVGFGVIVVVGTALLGTALSLTIGTRLAGVDWSFLMLSDTTGAMVEALIGVALLVWAVARLTRRPPRPPKPRQARSGAALLGVGVLFALGAVLDPTFVGLVVLAGRESSLPAIVLAHLVWVLVSQSPLVVLLVAVLQGRHHQAVEWFRQRWERAQPVVQRVVTVALLLGGALLVLDVVWFVATGSFLLPAPA